MTTTAPRLYQLADGIRALIEEADDADLAASLDALQGAFEVKAESIAALYMEFSRLADLCEQEEARLARRKNAARDKAEWLRGYLLAQMKVAERDRIDTDRFTIAIRQNPPAVQIVDEEQVPQEFIERRVSLHVDKRAILARVKETGELVPGIEIRRTERLEVR